MQARDEVLAHRALPYLYAGERRVTELARGSVGDRRSGLDGDFLRENEEAVAVVASEPEALAVGADREHAVIKREINEAGVFLARLRREHDAAADARDFLLRLRTANALASACDVRAVEHFGDGGEQRLHFIEACERRLEARIDLAPRIAHSAVLADALRDEVANAARDLDVATDADLLDLRGLDDGRVGGVGCAGASILVGLDGGDGGDDFGLADGLDGHDVLQMRAATCAAVCARCPTCSVPLARGR